MIRKRSLMSRLFEIFLVGLTFVTHWLIFYFVIITACKTTEDAARLTLELPGKWNLAENLVFIFSTSTVPCLRHLKTV